MDLGIPTTQKGKCKSRERSHERKKRLSPYWGTRERFVQEIDFELSLKEQLENGSAAMRGWAFQVEGTASRLGGKRARGVLQWLRQSTLPPAADSFPFYTFLPTLLSLSLHPL